MNDCYCKTCSPDDYIDGKHILSLDLQDEKDRQSSKKEELGVIDAIDYGYQDHIGACLYCHIKMLGRSCFWIFSKEQSDKIFDQYKLGSLTYLKGKIVKVTRDGNLVKSVEIYE